MNLQRLLRQRADEIALIPFQIPGAWGEAAVECIDQVGRFQSIARSLMALIAFACLAAPGASAAVLVIQVQNIRASQGVIYAAVCATGFAEGDCPYRDRQAAAAGMVELRIQDVRPGAYAIAAFLDLNGNGRLDRFLFIPTEPFGFSNDVGRNGPPSFEAAKVSIREPVTTVVVRLQ